MEIEYALHSKLVTTCCHKTLNIEIMTVSFGAKLACKLTLNQKDEKCKKHIRGPLLPLNVQKYC